MLWRLFFLWYSFHGLMKGRTMAKSTPQHTHSLAVGEEVLYHADDRWHRAEIIEVRPGDELVLSCELGDEIVTQRATHGGHVFGWRTYEEAAQSVG